MSRTLAAQLTDLANQISTIIVGKRAQIEDCIACLLAGGHLLIEDVPGVGKTTLAHAIAVSLGLTFSRSQFTADLMPSDLIGVSVYERAKEAFVFHAGPVFTHVLLADEINRAGPKTQSALLEAMEEHQVTVEGQTRALPAPFFVIATQNPTDQLGTYPLPESQMDRFFIRLSLGYPAEEEEKMLLRRGGTERVLAAIPSVLSPDEVLALQDAAEKIVVADRLLDYVQGLVRATRQTSELRLPVSTRGAQALYRAVQSHALLHGRTYATPDDVHAVAEAVLSHRILSISSDGFGAGGREREIVRKILAQVRVPV